MLKRTSFQYTLFFFLLRISIFCFLLFIISEIGFSQTQSYRTVNLKVVVDEEYRSQTTWRLNIKRLIISSSEDFEKYFGIKFRIKTIDNWLSDNARESTFELLNDLIKQAHNNLAVIFYYQKKYDLAWKYLKNAEDLGIKIHPDFKKEVCNKIKKK